ncbi:MAG: hypothetical protein AAFZ18_16965 [Myxococcota bacterium]
MTVSKRALAGALAFFATPAALAQTAGKVEPTQLGQAQHRWHPVSLTSGGASVITFERPDRRRRLGSLEQVLPAPGSLEQSTAVEIFADDVTLVAGQGLQPSELGFGRLSDLRRASYRWYRDSSSTATPFLATAFRLMVHDPDDGEYGSTWYLVYEPVYAGYHPTVPVDTWVRSNVHSSTVWRYPVYLNGQLPPADYCRNHSSECYRYDRTPLDWEFGPNAVVISVQLTTGGGWSGTYRGYVDDVRLRFRGRQGGRHIWNFEPL